MMSRRFFAVSLAFAFAAGGLFFRAAAQDHGDTPEPVEVWPWDAAVHYSGRFDMRDKREPRCEWPASMISLKFSGKDISVKLDDTGHNSWQTEIDGKPGPKLDLHEGTHSYWVAAGLADGDHIVTLTKATEGFAGVTQFLGFELDPTAKAEPFPAPAHRIEVIGDSISCGFGVEASNQFVHFTLQTENAYYAYGAVAARALGAEYCCIAYSGRKMWPDNTMPELYDRTLTDDASLKWDFSSWTPDAVVINLGTNDFGKELPDETEWTGAYRKFIERVRGYYPKAMIYCATGPMLGDSDARKAKSTLLAYVKQIVSTENAIGDKNVRAIDFGEQDPQNGFGADWHPSQKTQQLMADKLTAALRNDLGWK